MITSRAFHPRCARTSGASYANLPASAWSTATVSMESKTKSCTSTCRRAQTARRATTPSMSCPTATSVEVMSGLGGQARLLLLWVGDTLAGFNLFILERDRVVGRYLGLRYPLAREHNLYFVNWLTMVSFCIEHGYRTLQVGQTSYTLKAKLGCKLHRSWIYCKHTGLFRGALFRLLSPYAAFDRMDPDLRNLGGDAPYADPPQRVV